jgi:hypothetical protein
MIRRSADPQCPREEIKRIGVHQKRQLHRARKQRVSDKKFEAEPAGRTLAEVSALADGTLEPRRAAELRSLIASSPELGERYRRERQAVRALRSLSVDRAPASLRFAIETRRHRTPRRRLSLLYGATLASAAALVALLVLLLPGGTPGGPSVSQAAALALRGPALAAPTAEGEKLSINVGAVYFPNWSRSFHLRAVGQRIDQLDGRLAVTVYYERAGKQIAYTILAAPPLRWSGSRTLHLGGIDLQSFVARGRLVVTWRRGGETCVLSGAGVSIGQLAKLAGWRE